MLSGLILRELVETSRRTLTARLLLLASAEGHMKALMLGAAASLMTVLIAPPVGAQQDSVRNGGRAEIKRAQEALEQAGHDPGPTDGIMGSRTGAALRAYQKQHRLSVTGRLDEATRSKLKLGRAANSQTGGDRQKSAVDPAQAENTGANAGEGASYNRSTEKGKSTK
jgi:peptidoglycan hydrolase-like protein with peptidoglycan-binding domain